MRATKRRIGPEELSLTEEIEKGIIERIPFAKLGEACDTIFIGGSVVGGKYFWNPPNYSIENTSEEETTMLFGLGSYPYTESSTKPAQVAS